MTEVAKAYKVRLVEEKNEENEKQHSRSGNYHGFGQSLFSQLYNQQSETVTVVTSDPAEIYDFFGTDKVQSIREMGKGIYIDADQDLGIEP